jgi:2,5-diketo-D-gluconate reductase B
MRPIPAIGYGTWPLAGKAARDGVLMALDIGFRHIDTAQLNTNERAVGEALKVIGLPRQDIFIVTKVAPANLTADRFIPSVEKSLSDLGLAAIDLLLIHWPPRERALLDPAIDLLVETHAHGLAQQIGVSNFSGTMLARAAQRSSVPLATNQVEFHPMIDQQSLLDEARRLNVRLTAYAALGRCACLGNPVIQSIAHARGVSEAEVIFAWILAQDIIVLTQTTKRAHAEASFRSQFLELSADEIAAISALREANRRFVTPEHLMPGWDLEE